MGAPCSLKLALSRSPQGAALRVGPGPVLPAGCVAAGLDWPAGGLDVGDGSCGVGAAERRGAGTAGALSPPTPMRPRALKNHDSLILSHTHALHHPSIHPGPA